MSDLICTNCKKNLEDVKEQNNSEYAVYDDDKILKIFCKNCILEDSKTNYVQWNYYQIQWSFNFSNIEKAFYDEQVGISAGKNAAYKKEVDNNLFEKNWNDMHICYRWRLLECLRSWGEPFHTFLTRTCKECQKSVNNSKKLEYGYYQWGIESEILCRDCIKIDMQKESEKEDWENSKHMWESHFSLADKMWNIEREKSEYEDNRLGDIELEEWDKMDLVHQWCVVRRMQELGLDNEYPHGKMESRPLDICQVTKQDIHPDKTIFIKDNGEDSLVCTCHHIPIAVRDEITNMIPQDPTSREIFAFIHCKMCIDERKEKNIEIGWTKTGFLVRCITHNRQIGHFSIPPELIPVGCECPECKDNEK